MQGLSSQDRDGAYYDMSHRELANVDVSGGSIASSSRLNVGRGATNQRDISPRNAEPRQNGYEPSRTNAKTRVIQVFNSFMIQSSVFA